MQKTLGKNLSGEVLGIDLFPDLSAEIDRRILHSEQRIKYWVIAGVLAQLMTLVIAVIPVIFFLGQISRDISAATLKIDSQQAQMDRKNDLYELRFRERMMWQYSAEQWMRSKGYKPAHTDVPNE